MHGLQSKKLTAYVKHRIVCMTVAKSLYRSCRAQALFYPYLNRGVAV